MNAIILETTEETRVRLLSTAVSDFTEQDRADWLRVFGWCMPVRRPYTPRLCTVRELWGYGTR